MKSQRLFIKALTPIVSIVFLLAGVILLRAQFWITGTSCFFLALFGFIYSIRLSETSPFTPEEMDALNPSIPTLLVWLLVFSLTMVAVLYVADSVKSAKTDRVADLAFISSLILGLLIVWWKSLKPGNGLLIQKKKTTRIELGF